MQTVITGRFPDVRLRRNRQHHWSRRLMAEHALTVDDLILPVFVREKGADAAVPSLSGVRRYTLDELLDHAGEIVAAGLPAIALFPHYNKARRAEPLEALLTEENILCQAIRALKKTYPTLGLITDVALDCYTAHGQDALVHEGEILNDETLEIISRYAVTQAKAGADVIAPSEMMDGRVGAIRKALDAAGYSKVSILSYAAKYASNLYTPFREAVGSRACLGEADKKTYQLAPENALEAIREVALDVEEGADMILVKPGLPYLDIVYRVKSTFGMPTFVFHVSGEYAMLKAAAEAGSIDYHDSLYECLIGCKRAGADGIFSYGALDMAAWLKEIEKAGS